MAGKRFLLYTLVLAGAFIDATAQTPARTAIKNGHNHQADTLIQKDTAQLANVTVTGQVIHKDQVATVIKTTISGRDLEETRGYSLGESLKSITGVNSIQTGPSISKPVIHGVYSNRILILNNGVRQEGQNWGNDHAPEIDPFIATKLSVVKGAASIRYGSDAIGGVVLTESRDLRNTPGIDGEVNAVGMTNGRIGTASAMIEGATGGQLQGLSWRAQGTLKKAGNAEAANYYMGNTGYHEDDYSGTLKYTKKNYGAELYYSRFDTKIGVADASVVGTIQDLYSAFTRTEPAVKASFTYDVARPYQLVTHQLVKASAFLILPHERGRIDVVYAYQKDVRKEYDADSVLNPVLAAQNPPDVNFRLNTSTVDAIWQHPAIGKKITGSIGLNFITHGNLQQGTGYQEIIPNFVDYGGGLFAIEKIELHKLTLEGGLRYDYRWLQAYTLDARTLLEQRPTYNWQNTSTNIGAIYHFSEAFSVTYNFGTAWRAPQAIELFANGIHQSAASYETGNDSLTLEKAYNNNLTFTYRHHNFQAELGFYVNYFHHFIYLKPDSVPRQTIQGAFPAYTYTQVNALFKGIDLNISYTFLQHFTILSKTSIVRARNLTIHDWLINVPADRFDNTLRYELPAWGGIRHFFIGINNLVVSTQTRVPPKSDYVNPPPGYMLWGADIGCSVPFFTREASINLTITNLTNVAYRDYLNRFRYFMDDVGRNISVRMLIPFDFNSQTRGKTLKVI